MLCIREMLILNNFPKTFLGKKKSVKSYDILVVPYCTVPYDSQYICC